MVTFEADGEEITAALANSFKAIDRNGRMLKKDDRFRVFKEGNVTVIGTTKSDKKEVITDVKVTRGSLSDR
jgi:hypothetical protein